LKFEQNVIFFKISENTHPVKPENWRKKQQKPKEPVRKEPVPEISAKNRGKLEKRAER
jgi:hypothetical protein